MKQSKFSLVPLAAVLALSLLAVQPVFSAITARAEVSTGNVFNIPSKAVKMDEDTYSLGEVDVKGEKVQGYAFIHRKDGFLSGFGTFRAPTKCYAFLSTGARWKVTEPYMLNTSNGDGLSDGFVASAIDRAMEAWDSQVAFDVFGPRAEGAVDGADSSKPDGKNEIMFGSISQRGAIAVTIVWGIFSGPVANRRLVEFDMVLDDEDFRWGDAGPTSETSLGNKTLMDLENVAAHEIGHAAGIGHPSSLCAQETMYSYTRLGETKKRTLNSGDIAGIKALYK